MLAEGNTKRKSHQKADDVRDIGHVRIVAVNPAGVGDDDDVINEIKKRHQALGRKKQPGKFERSHEHHASGQGKDGRRGSQCAGSTRYERQAQDECGEASSEKDRQVIAPTDLLLERAAEDE